MPNTSDTTNGSTAGAITALASVEGRNGQPLLIAGSMRALHVSRDCGGTWSFEPVSGGVTSIATLPKVPNTNECRVLVGSPSGCFLVDPETGAQTLWLRGGGVLAVAAASLPADEGTTRYFAGTAFDGLLRSDDGPEAWTPANAGLTETAVQAFALSPSFASDATGFLATFSGVYRTRNGGRAWRRLDLPEPDLPVQCLALSPTHHDLWVGTEGMGVFRSTDWGDSWSHAGNLATSTINALRFSRDGESVFAGTQDGIVVCQNDGQVQYELAAGLGPVLSIGEPGVDAEGPVVAGLLDEKIAILQDHGRHLDQVRLTTDSPAPT
jgi:photosystem II stability/assembly factor-like uncharacterized protein